MPDQSNPSHGTQGPGPDLAVKRETTLMVIEFSAAWPRWLRPNHFADATVIAQDHGQSPIVLIAEVARRAAHLQAIDCRLGTVVVVSNGGTAVTEAAARHSLVRGLLARLAALGGKKLVLTVDPAAGRRACRDLDVLARSFERQARQYGIELLVRIGKEQRDLYSAELLAPLARAG